MDLVEPRILLLWASKTIYFREKESPGGRERKER